MLLNYLLTALFMYLGLILAFKVLPNRSSGKLNNFDWLITIACGAILANTIFDSRVSFWEGLAVIYFLLLCQHSINKLAFRYPELRRMLQNSPKVLWRQGDWIESNLVQESVTKEEVLSAVRSAGHPDLEQVSTILIEPSGSISVQVKPR